MNAFLRMAAGFLGMVLLLALFLFAVAALSGKLGDGPYLLILLVPALLIAYALAQFGGMR